MDPQKKVLSSLKNIEEGKATEDNTDYLTETTRYSTFHSTGSYADA